MRLGLDIAAMAHKRQVDQIVLVAADADFVPPVKLARREGIDVVLDPMGAPVAPISFSTSMACETAICRSTPV